MQTPSVKSFFPARYNGTATSQVGRTLPANARIFIIRGLALVIGWNILYKMILLPAGIPDTQISGAVQYLTAKCLSILYKDVTQHNASVIINGVRSINIAHACNGLELIVLYLGFILCIPGPAKKLLLFSVNGILIIFLLNVLRCTLLGWMYYEQLPLADFAHHYAFKMVVYAAVFYGWLLYTRKPKEIEA